MVLVVPVRAGPQHGCKPCAHRMQHALAQLPRHRAVGQRNRSAVGELDGANVERIGAAMFGQDGADDAVAAAAFERVEIVEVGDDAAEASCQRRHVGADPVGDRRRHGAAEDRRRLDRDPALVGQHHGFQPHQVFSTAAAGAVDIGNAGGDGNRLGQRQPAGRGLGRRRGLLGRLVSLGGGLFCNGGLFWLGRRRIRGTRLRQGDGYPEHGPALLGLLSPNRMLHGAWADRRAAAAESGCPQSTAAPPRRQ